MLQSFDVGMTVMESFYSFTDSVLSFSVILWFGLKSRKELEKIVVVCREITGATRNNLQPL